MIFSKIKELLDKNNIKYELKHHEPLFTSEQAARVRGDSLKQGAKSIVMKSKDKYFLIVISGAKRINSKKLKKILNVKSLSFISEEELEKITGLKTGAIPPFGSVLDLQTYVDKSLLENKEISFNAGSRTDSIKMKSKDYLLVENPIVCEFSE